MFKLISIFFCLSLFAEFNNDPSQTDKFIENLYQLDKVSEDKLEEYSDDIYQENINRFSYFPNYIWSSVLRRTNYTNRKHMYNFSISTSEFKFYENTRYKNRFDYLSLRKSSNITRFSSSIHRPWVASISPSLDLKSDYFQKNINEELYEVDSDQFKQLSSGLDKFFSSIHFHRGETDFEQNPVFNIPGVFTATCTQISMRNIFSCAKQLKNIIKSMKPYSLFSFESEAYTIDETSMILTSGTEYLYILKRKEIIQYILNLSNHISDLIKQDDSSSTFFELMQQEAFKLNLNENDIWDTIALLSSSGANLSYRLRKIFSQVEFHSSYISYDEFRVLEQFLFHVDNITSGMTLMDSKRIEKRNSLFSFPQDLELNLTSYKPYHFWMTAFLARRAYIQQKNWQAAFSASFLSNVGYQVFGPRKLDAFWGTSSFHPLKNKTRIDLLLSAAGAYWGATSIIRKSCHSMGKNSFKNWISSFYQRSQKNICSKNLDFNRIFMVFMKASNNDEIFHKEENESIFNPSFFNQWKKHFPFTTLSDEVLK